MFETNDSDDDQNISKQRRQLIKQPWLDELKTKNNFLFSMDDLHVSSSSDSDDDSDKMSSSSKIVANNTKIVTKNTNNVAKNTKIVANNTKIVASNTKIVTKNTKMVAKSKNATKKLLPVVSVLETKMLLPVVSSVESKKSLPVVSVVESKKLLPVFLVVEPRMLFPVASVLESKKSLPVVSVVEARRLLPVVATVKEFESITLVPLASSNLYSRNVSNTNVTGIVCVKKSEVSNAKRLESLKQRQDEADARKALMQKSLAVSRFSHSHKLSHLINRFYSILYRILW